jgi:hypothetical protein
MVWGDRRRGAAGPENGSKRPFGWSDKGRRGPYSTFTRDALKAAKARGVVLGIPGLRTFAGGAVASTKANADQFAKKRGADYQGHSGRQVS